MDISKNIEEAKEVAEECKVVADELSIQRARVSLRGNLSKAFFAGIGMIAIIVTYIPEASTSIGEGGVKYVSLLVAILLILSSVGGYFGKSDPPERYEDFAHYIRHHQTSIEITISDQRLDEELKHDTLLQQVTLAKKNLNDVRNKWQSLYQRALSKKNS